MNENVENVPNAAVGPEGNGAADRQFSCPNCEKGFLSPFYRAGDIPVHSCLLMASREEAMHYPRADLELGWCRKCGFISNLRFDPSYREYDSSYEETQGFSARFSRFQTALVDRLIKNYGIRRKTVLEIGCGKGEFLSLLCRRGDNRGIAVDPACVPERIPVELRRRLTIIRDY